jgi:2-polyprenyl-6-hydroxyphenyl methylase/3-demethylubiquinone-9 3-methyltransferase
MICDMKKYLPWWMRIGAKIILMRFLTVLNNERIEMAEALFKRMLGIDDLKGKRFLDIGSGSLLCSLAASRVGVAVHSVDYDPQSLACTMELKRGFF